VIAPLALGLAFAALVATLFVVHGNEPNISAAAPEIPGPAIARPAPQSSDLPIPAPPPVETLRSPLVEAPKGIEASPHSDRARSARPRAEGSKASSAAKEQPSTTAMPASPPPTVNAPLFHSHTDLEQKN
jgi:hypothetical protein